MPKVAGGGKGVFARLLPGLWSLRHYRRSWLRGDVLAGITVAAYLVPQVMAYAEVAGLPPVTGLWTAVGPLAVYAVLGSSRSVSVGPEASTVLMTAVAITAMTGTGASRTEAASALAVAVGVLCLLGWLGRLGFLADLLSRPVLTGYMVGIAVVMIAGQLGAVTGLKVHGSSVAAQVGSTVVQLSRVHLPTLVLAAVSLVLLLALQHRFRRFPGPLLIMVLATSAVAVGHLNRVGIAVVGAVPSGLPRPDLPDFSVGGLAQLLPAALGVAVVAYSDTVITGRAFADRQATPVDPRQEFLALGAANLASGVLHGFPVSSSVSRTVLGLAMGARSQLYALVALATVLGATFFLSPVLALFPAAALGAIVIYAAIRMIDIAQLRRIGHFRRSELALCLLTTISVLAFGVLYGIAVAVGLSVADLLRRITRPHDGILGFAPGVPGMHDIADYPGTRQVPGLVVYRYDSPLFFANADDFKRRALAAVDDADGPVRWFLLNAEAIVDVDLTAADALESVRSTLAARGVTVALARVKYEVQQQLARAGFVDRVGGKMIFATLPTAVAAYRSATSPPPGTEPTASR